MKITIRSVLDRFFGCLLFVFCMVLSPSGVEAVNETPGNGGIAPAHIGYVYSSFYWQATRGESEFASHVGPSGQQYGIIQHLEMSEPDPSPSACTAPIFKSILEESDHVGAWLITGHGGNAPPMIAIESYGRGDAGRDAALAALSAYTTGPDPIFEPGEILVGWTGQNWSINITNAGIRGKSQLTEHPLVFVGTCYGNSVVDDFTADNKARIAVGMVEETNPSKTRQAVETMFSRMDGYYGVGNRSVSEAIQGLDVVHSGALNTTLAPVCISLVKDPTGPPAVGDKLYATFETSCNTGVTPDMTANGGTVDNEQWLNDHTLEGTVTAVDGGGQLCVTIPWENTYSNKNIARLDGNTNPPFNGKGPAHDDFVQRGGAIYVDINNVTGPWDGSQAHPLRYITDGINALSALGGCSGEVLVLPGTYDVASGETFPIRLRTAVILKSTQGPDVTIIDGDTAQPVISCEEAADNPQTIEGFTITGGKCGIKCLDSALALTIRGNIITENGEEGLLSNGGIYTRGSVFISENTIYLNKGISGAGIICYLGPTIITKNTITQNEASHSGGGISCQNGSATIRENTLTQNQAIFGGGIYCYTSYATITENTITQNQANSGGGIYVYAATAGTKIIGNQITANSASAFGAGIRVSGGTGNTEIIGNGITTNSSSSSGGGIHGSGGNWSIAQNIITDNESPSSGSGIYWNEGSPIITDNTIAGNSGAVFGGGICIYHGADDARITGNRIIANPGRGEGGGIYARGGNYPIAQNVVADNYGGGVALWECGIVLTGNTICNNRKHNYGAGVEMFTASGPIKNNILYGNASALCANYGHYDPCRCQIYDWSSKVPDFNPEISYCLIQRGYPGVGIIDADPCFVDTANYDFHLLPWSPCIDAGDPSDSVGDEPWPNGGRINIGCYGGSVEATISIPVIRVYPDTLDFGYVEVGEDSVLSLKIRNPGHDTLYIYEIATINPVFSFSDTTFSVSIGDSFNVSVAFSPTEEIMYSEVLTIFSNADTVDVALTGAGYVDLQCQVNPDSLDFGTVIMGDSLDKTFDISNTDGGILSGTVSEACADYSLVGDVTYSLTAGQSKTFTVRFAPTSAGVKNCTVETGNGACVDVSCTGTSLTDCEHPVHFVFRDSTAVCYAIVIDSAFLDGLELRKCDEVGVFADTCGGLLCVGAVVYHPDSLPINFCAWKDDPLTPQKDGYTPGDTMYFRVWSRNQDREECAVSHYLAGDGTFAFGAYSQLWLEAPCPCEDAPLHAGWQWISTNIDPDQCEMESVFVNCWDDLDIVIACDGSFCIPEVGCWIDCWNVSEMYKLHMADACTIQVCGSKIPTDTPRPLPAGWNCIAYFPECPLEPETALVSIWDNLDIVKNDDGEFCIPGVGCWIECMEYNEGYKIHLANADTLMYPTSCPPCPPPFAKRNSYPGFAKTAHFNCLAKTGESHSIVVNSVELSEKHLEVGDEIGVFTSSGLCVGAGVWQGGILGIAAWQDNDRTEEMDGFQVGEQMIFKLWDKSENKEIELFASFEKGDGRFGTVADPAFGGDVYALVNLKGVSSQQPDKFELVQNYPNPFNLETEISYALPKDCHVKLTIYNLLGQKIKILVDEHQTAGYKRVYWDGKDNLGNDVASGIYFYQIKAGGFTETKKLVLLK